MSLAYFIARRIHFSKGDADAARRVSPPAIRIAIAGIAIGLAVMILSVAIVVGFKEEVREKVIGFGAHIQVQAFSSNVTYETQPICISDSLLTALRHLPHVKSVRPYATKPAVLKTADDFLSIAVKGLSGNDNRDFFVRNLKTGSLPDYGVLSTDTAEADDENRMVPDDRIVVSQIIADRMHLSVGDEVQLYFIRADAADEYALGRASASVRSRRLRVAGIYETHFNEYDRQFILADLHLLQEVSGWDGDEVSGLEIMLTDFSCLDAAYDELYFSLAGLTDRKDNAFYTRSIEQINPQIFSWLDLLDTNVWVILILISAVATFTMTSGLLIIILERTHMIGILKALGYDNGGIRRIFLYIALFLTGKGLIWGNLIGLTLCFVQNRWHLIHLDPQNYYLEWVPIALSPWHILLLNAGTIVITLCVLFGPSALVSSIRPSRVMQTE